MSADLQETPKAGDASLERLEQSVLGFRRLSNQLLAVIVTIGGLGFTLTCLSSYLGRDLLPIGSPSTLLFVPQAACELPLGDDQHQFGCR